MGSDEGLEIRVGTDIEAISEVAASIERFGERYGKRLFTPHEVDCSGGLCAAGAPGLTARFAAKEATFKVLRLDDGIPPWDTIEVRRRTGGWTELLLSGQAAALAEAAGIVQLSVSLSHGAGVGMATVVALCHSPAPGPEPSAFSGHEVSMGAPEEDQGATEIGVGHTKTR
jgi:holo-[acyl-carrier protein] synthase